MDTHNIKEITLYLLTGTLIGSILSYMFWENIDFQIITTMVLAVTAFIILYQAYQTRKAAQYSLMPNITFLLKSGKSRQHDENVNVKNMLFTKIIIYNHSKFAVSCWMNIIVYLRMKESDHIDFKKKYQYEKGSEHGWILPPGKSEFPITKNILPEAILDKKYGEMSQEDNYLFEERIKEIQGVIAEFEIISKPLMEKDVKFELNGMKWEFILEEMQWIDPQGARELNYRNI